MYHLRVALALCLSGLLAASLAQETDHGEQTDAVLEGEPRNVREIRKQIVKRNKRHSEYVDKRLNASIVMLW